MSLFIVLLAVALAIALFALPLRKRSQVERFLGEIDRTEDEEELAQAEEEVRGLDALASPEDAAERLPDWGPGVPRTRKRS